MVRLDDMRVFAALAEAGSFTGAAAVLGVPKQTVSRRLAELEAALGVELARRTTRTLTLTDVGRAYAARCAEVARLADEANRAAASRTDLVSGILRITADSSFGEALLPDLVAAYVRENDGVNVEVLLTARKVDLVDEGIDAAFRVGPPPDVAHLAATRLGPAHLWTVAAPAYLERRGTPTTLADLATHDCVAAIPEHRPAAWPFAIDGTFRLVPIIARMRVNAAAMARHGALAALGVAHLPQFAAIDDVAAGRLVRLLPEHTPEVGGLHVVYPHTYLLAPKVRRFVEMAVAHFRGLIG
jgi:DNA-binding transcriptional LysR family regulator